MKKLITLILSIAAINIAIAVTPLVDNPTASNANNIMLPIGKTGNTISLSDFSTLKTKEYAKLANVKLGFIERIFYKLSMKKLRKSIAADGTITNKKLLQLFSPDDRERGFNAEGFGLGFLLGFVGIAIAYLAFKDDERKNRIKWAWLGAAAAMVLGLILLFALIALLARR